MPPPLEIDIITQQLTIADADLPDINLLASVDSTNSWAGAQVRQGRTDNFVCFAEQQTAGRGRRGRSWASPAGSGIYMSLAWPFSRPLHELSVLPLAMAVAIERCLRAFNVGNIELKWPNDVLVCGRKLAGVLIETAASTDRHCHAVIGIGMNVQVPAAAIDIETEWADLATVLGTDATIERSAVAGVLLNECLHMCLQYQQQGVALLHSLQPHYAHYQQQPVQLRLDNGEQLSGIAQGVTDIGELCVLIEGEQRVFNSADVSLSRAG